MKWTNRTRRGAGILVLCALLAGCAATAKRKDRPKEFPVPEEEARWIREGDPILYQGKRWHPLDMTENLLDSEVYYLGDYRGVPFFVEQVDVKPYNRIYTKFGKNQFRVFEPGDYD